MEREVNNLLAILRGFLLEEPVRLGEADPLKLYTLAQAHNVAGIVGCMDNAWGFLPETDVKEELKKTFMASIASFARRADLAHQLFCALEASGIAHCPVKGIVLREDYPVPELRSFSDVDFLIRSEDRERAHELMRSLGFSVKTDWEPVYSYQRGTEYYEIHTALLETDIRPDVDYPAYFSQAWQYTVRETEYGYGLKREFHFLYLLTHIAKHAQNRGAGIRMYLDIAAFLQAQTDRLDWPWISRELETLKLRTFACTVLSCVESWFGVSCPTEFDRIDRSLEQRFLMFTMEAGLFGNYGRNSGLNTLRKQKKSSRCAALLSRAFPDAASIENRYTYLAGRHYLLPIAWVHRFFRTGVFFREHTREAKDILTADSAEVLRLQSICKDVGL